MIDPNDESALARIAALYSQSANRQVQGKHLEQNGQTQAPLAQEADPNARPQERYRRYRLSRGEEPNL